MKTFNYDSYDHYVERQRWGNEVKANWVYANENTIRQIVAEYPKAKSVLCHGTRAGAEQEFFKKLLGEDAHVIGTEIGDSADSAPMTIKHDFNEQREDFINAFDIIYSNSVDHAFNVRETLSVWRDQLSATGIMFLEYAAAQSTGCDVDPLDATDEEMREVIHSVDMRIINEITSSVKHAGRVFVCEKV